MQSSRHPSLFIEDILSRLKGEEKGQFTACLGIRLARFLSIGTRSVTEMVTATNSFDCPRGNNSDARRDRSFVLYSSSIQTPAFSMPFFAVAGDEGAD